MTWSLIDLCEAGRVPDSLLRWGIRRQLRSRLRQEESRQANDPDPQAELARSLSQGPMVAYVGEANRQHYEVPTEFFRRVLGKHLKYSSGYWPTSQTTLDEAEATMLDLTVERAEIEDGQQILELGCGWGSLTRWLADRFPQSTITAISNSRTQREFIESELARRGHRHVRVVTVGVSSVLVLLCLRTALEA